MSKTIGLTVDRWIERLLRAARETPALEGEFLASAAEFFPTGAPLALGAAALLASRRHAEWFLCERWSPAAANLPVDLLAAGMAPEEGDHLLAGESTCLRSFAGVFEVREVLDDRGLALLDLTSLEHLEAREEHSTAGFAPGDLIVGRVFPLHDGTYHVSRAAGVWRDPGLRAAFEADLERIRADRDRARFRISQAALEGMFFASAPAQPSAPQDAALAVERARELLAGAGLDGGEIEALFAALAADPPRPAAPLAVPPALVGVLDRLAFESHVDLELARRTLIAAWNATAQSHDTTATRRDRTSQAVVGEPQTGTGSTGEPRERAAVRRALEEFDRERLGDWQAALDKLEQRLGLTVEDDDESEASLDELGAGPSATLQAMLLEYAWEGGLTGDRGPEADARLLEPFAAATRPLDAIDDLTRGDVIAFAAVWLPDHAQRIADVPATLAALGRFCSWIDATSAVHGFESLADELAGLAGELPRVLAIGRLVAADAVRRDTDEFGVVRARGAGQVTLQAPDGRTQELPLVAALADSALAIGDVVRHRRGPGGAAQLIAVYPPLCAELWPRHANA